MGKLRLLAAVLTAAAAMARDLKTGKVPNRLILAALAAALALLPAETLVRAAALMTDRGEAWQDVLAAVAACMAAAFLRSLAGGMIPLLFPGILFPVGMMGGGDIKLFAALGALLGMDAVLRIIPAAFIAGACQALVWLAVRRDGRERARRLRTYIQAAVLLRQPLDYGGRSGAGRGTGQGQGAEGRGTGQGQGAEGRGAAGKGAEGKGAEGKPQAQMHFTVSIMAAVLWYAAAG